MATYICIFILNIDPETLKKGVYFKEDFDTRLKSLRWLEIKNLSWLSGNKDEPKFQHKNDLTQAQLDVVFDYCEKHKFEYPYS